MFLKGPASSTTNEVSQATYSPMFNLLLAVAAHFHIEMMRHCYLSGHFTSYI